jgi:hypothetical protein
MLINRDLTAIAAPSVSAAGGIVQPLPHPVFAIGISEDAPDPTANQGGMASGLNAVSGAGRVYAAVRFTAVTNLRSPVYLEIRGNDGTLLASKPIYAREGEVVEAYVGYIIGSYENVGVFPGEFEPRTIVDRPVQVFTDPPLEASEGPPPPPDIDTTLRVQVVQYGPSQDAWKVDSLTLFDDSILWEFSNDGGTTWTPAFGIRNNVNGILTFPKYGNSLRWRVTAYRDNLHVTALQIRPWYSDRLALRTSGPHRGPNVSTFDQEPPIQDDPEFNTWTKPIPRQWFLEGRRFPKTPPTGTPPTNEESNFFARNAEEMVDTPVDVSTRQSTYERYGYVEYDPEALPHEVPGEPVEVPVDVAARTNSVFYRTIGDTVTLEDDQAFGLWVSADDPVNKSPMAPPF